MEVNEVWHGVPTKGMCSLEFVDDSVYAGWTLEVTRHDNLKALLNLSSSADAGLDGELLTEERGRSPAGGHGGRCLLLGVHSLLHSFKAFGWG